MSRTTRTPAARPLTGLYDMPARIQALWVAYDNNARNPALSVLAALPRTADLRRPVNDGVIDLKGLLPADTNTLPREEHSDHVEFYHVNADRKPFYANSCGFYSDTRSVDEEMIRVQEHLSLKAGGTLYMIFRRDDRHGYSPAYLATRIRLTKGVDTPKPEPRKNQEGQIYPERLIIRDKTVAQAQQAVTKRKTQPTP